MLFGGAYDPETVNLMSRALEGAVRELQANSPLHFGASNMVIRKALARRIMAAVELGQAIRIG